MQNYTWKHYATNGITPPIADNSRLAYYDGSLYLWGTYKEYNSIKGELFRYDLSSESWSIVETLSDDISYIQGHGMFTYNTDLYIINGYELRTGEFHNRIHHLNLDAENKVWEEATNPEVNRNKAAFAYVCEGDILYMFGGLSKEGQTNQLLEINLKLIEESTELSKSMRVPTARYGHSMEVYNDKLYIFGGVDKYGSDLIDMTTFDIKTETWTPLLIHSNHAPVARSEFAYTRMGEILVIFGGSSGSVLLGDMHYFNLRTQEWKAVEPKSQRVPSNRKGACMAAAGNTIFIFGGISNEGYSNELWAFESGSNTYTLLEPFGNYPSKSARGKCRAFISNEEIIFETYLGETDGRQPLIDIHQYNLAQKTWIMISKPNYLNIERSQASALFFGNKLLVAGGSFWNFIVKNTVYIYDFISQEIPDYPINLPFSIYNGASIYYKNKLYMHGGGASLNSLPLPDIPINHLVIIDLDDECTQDKEFCKSKCSPGTYYSDGECMACPKGTFKDFLGPEECTKCAKGYYSDAKGADSPIFCKPCPLYTFNLNEGEDKCYNCPSGIDCSTDNIEFKHQQSTESYQPDIYNSYEDIVSEYSMIFNIVISLISFIVIISLFSFMKTRRILTNLDMYTLQHNYKLDHPMVARKTIIGGIASISFIVVAMSIVFSMGLTYGLDNIVETKALVPLVVLEQEYGSVISI